MSSVDTSVSDFDLISRVSLEAGPGSVPSAGSGLTPSPYVNTTSSVTTSSTPEKGEQAPQVSQNKKLFLRLTRNAFRPAETFTGYGASRHVTADLEARRLKVEVMVPSVNDVRSRLTKAVMGQTSTTAGMASTGGLFDLANAKDGRQLGRIAPLDRQSVLAHRLSPQATSDSAATGDQARILMSNDGNTLIAFSRSGKLTLWDVATGVHLSDLTIKAANPSTAILSEAGDLLIYGDPDNRQIHQYLLSNRKDSPTMYCEPVHPWEVDGYTPTQLAIALSPRGNTLAAMHVWHEKTAFSLKMKTYLSFFDMLTYTCASTIPIPASANARNNIALMNTNQDLGPYVCPTPDSPSHFFAAAFTSNGNEVILTVRHEAFLVDLLTRTTRRIHAGENSLLVKVLPVNLVPSNGRVIYASIARDWSNGTGTLLRLWSPATPTRVRLLSHPSSIVGLALSPGGTVLLVALSNLMVVLWDVGVSSERPVPLLRVTCPASLSSRHAPAFSPCGRFFVTYHTDACYLWRVPIKDLSLIRQLRQPDLEGWADLLVTSQVKWAGEQETIELGVGMGMANSHAAGEAVPPPSELGANFTDSGYASSLPPTRKQQFQRDPVGMSSTAEASQQNNSSDTATVYSDAPSLTDDRVGAYIGALVEAIVAAFPQSYDAEELDRISPTLLDLLKAFAIKIGYEDQTPLHQEVKYFVHKYRR